MPRLILQWSAAPVCPSIAVPWVLQASIPGTGERDPGPNDPLLCLLSKIWTISTDGVGEKAPLNEYF